MESIPTSPIATRSPRAAVARTSLQHAPGPHHGCSQTEDSKMPETSFPPLPTKLDGKDGGEASCKVQEGSEVIEEGSSNATNAGRNGSSVKTQQGFTASTRITTRQIQLGWTKSRSRKGGHRGRLITCNQRREERLLNED
ncbi:hypothetical protein R1flu_019509 [Riccia fluitans]|uniref:Uncharacterized protein n=1 Tax=Riccia fluitans TaxID=41844 RepID=A0ABD1ZL13_9MARC